MSYLSKHDNLEQRVNYLQEILKRNIPGFEKDRQDIDSQAQIQETRFKVLEEAIGHVNDTMVAIINKLDEQIQSVKGPVWDMLQRMQRENTSLNKEIDRQQDVYRKMMAEFAKTITDKKEQRIIEFLAD